MIVQSISFVSIKLQHVTGKLFMLSLSSFLSVSMDNGHATMFMMLGEFFF